MNFPTAAACAVHPSASSVGTCARCGNYMCAQCQSPQRPDMCATCVQHVGGFPLRRENVGVESAFKYAVDRFKIHWLPLCAMAFIYLAFFGVMGAANGGLQAYLITSSPKLLVPAAIVVGLMMNVFTGFGMAMSGRVAVASLTETAIGPEHVVQGLRRSPAFIAQTMIAYVVALPITVPQLVLQSMTGAGNPPPVWAMFISPLCTLIWIVPMIYILLGTSQMGLEAAIDPDVDVGESLKRSWAVANGRRMTLFGAGLAAGVIALAGIVACCVGLIPAMGVSLPFWAAIYLGLRTGLLPEPRPFPH